MPKKIEILLFSSFLLVSFLTQAQPKIMKYENLKHLPEIVQFMDEKSQESFYEIYAPQFVTNIFVEEIIYPNWVKDWEDKDELLAQIESKDLMEPINTMMRNADMALLTPEELANETGYYYVVISFAIKPSSKQKRNEKYLNLSRHQNK